MFHDFFPLSSFHSPARSVDYGISLARERNLEFLGGGKWLYDDWWALGGDVGFIKFLYGKKF